MFFGKKFKECDKWEKEESISSNITDAQTKNIQEGINLLLRHYPEAKLLVGYDQEIMMILPYKNKELEDKLSSIGWEHLEFIPWMWKYEVDGSVYNYHKEK